MKVRVEDVYADTFELFYSRYCILSTFRHFLYVFLEEIQLLQRFVNVNKCSSWFIEGRSLMSSPSFFIVEVNGHHFPDILCGKSFETYQGSYHTTYNGCIGICITSSFNNTFNDPLVVEFIKFIHGIFSKNISEIAKLSHAVAPSYFGPSYIHLSSNGFL